MDVQVPAHVSGGRVAPQPRRSVGVLALNTRAKPFSSPRARRAVSLALARSALVAGLHNDLITPTCHLIPPDLPGHRTACPPPDLAAARALVRASGMHGTPVALALDKSSKSLATGLIRTLDAIGFRTSWTPGQVDTFGQPGNDAQVGALSWQADYPSPANVFGGLLGCDAYQPDASSVNLAQYCNHRLDQAVLAASVAGGLHPADVAARWAQVDRIAVATGAVVPLNDIADRSVVSDAARDVRWSPMWGLLLQLVRPG